MKEIIRVLESEKTNITGLRLSERITEEVAERKIKNIQSQIDKIKNKTSNILDK